ncbi:hypothetical protein [Micromonospora sp. NPDC004704]
MGLRPPSRLGARGNLTDAIRTRCKVCRASILHTDDTAVWSRRPLGLVHGACASAPVGAR